MQIARGLKSGDASLFRAKINSDYNDFAAVTANAATSSLPIRLQTVDSLASRESNWDAGPCQWADDE